jgi:hypothetical protein
VEIKKEGQASSGRRDRWWLQHMASRALQQRLFGNISGFTAHFFYPFVFNPSTARVRGKFE